MYKSRSVAALVLGTYCLKTPFHTVGCHTKEGGKESINKMQTTIKTLRNFPGRFGRGYYLHSPVRT